MDPAGAAARFAEVTLREIASKRKRVANDRIRKQLENGRGAEDVIDAVYLFMDNDGELAPDEPYRIEIRASTRRDFGPTATSRGSPSTRSRADKG